MKQYWLMKTEPESFSIADLARVKIEPWTGVRSTFARFQMRQMQVGDEVLFYHSSAEPPGVAGLARVVRTNVVDETQFDPDSKYFDPKATRDKPIWDCVDVEYVSTLPSFVPLERLRGDPALADMMVLKRGMRLSVQPVTEAEYHRIVELAQTAWEPPAKPPKPRPKTTTKTKAKPARVAAKRSQAKPKPRTKRKRAKR